MPKGPNGQKRPADTIGCAVAVGRIATGEVEDDIKASTDLKDRGRKGGEARANSLNSAERKRIARRAANSRWKTERKSEMTPVTERQRLEQRFQSMKAQGLQDMKFHLGRVSEATTEEVYAEVNRLLDNVEAGRVQELPAWGDSRRK
jgi:hypothetical protein